MDQIVSFWCNPILDNCLFSFRSISDTKTDDLRIAQLCILDISRSGIPDICIQYIDSYLIIGLDFLCHRFKLLKNRFLNPTIAELQDQVQSISLVFCVQQVLLNKLPVVLELFLFLEQNFLHFISRNGFQPLDLLQKFLLGLLVMAEPLLTETPAESFLLSSCANFYFCRLYLTLLAALVGLFLLFFLLVKDKLGLFLVLDLISDLSCLWHC